MEKIFTIKNNAIFTRMYRAKSSAQSTVVVYFKQNRSLKKAHIGITASKKLGGAVQRNRVRRLIREAYRQLILDGTGINDTQYYYVFVARSKCFNKRIRMQEVYKDMKRAFCDIGVFPEEL